MKKLSISMNIKNILKSIITLFVLIHTTGILAQNNTMYFIDGIPDKTYLNPAKQPECNVYIGLPGASSSYSYYSSAFTVEDIAFPNAAGDSIIQPLHPEADKQKFLNLFDKSNILSFETQNNLISLGFRINRMFFTFNIALNQSTFFTYPDDFMQIVLAGTEEDVNYDLTSFGINSKTYIEYGIGISRKIMDNLSIGIRPKLYSGIYAVQADFYDVNLYTSLEEWRLTAKGDVNMAMPLVNPPTNADGELDFENNTFTDDLETEIDNLTADPASITSVLFDNKGFGIDLGVVYNPISKVELSASLVDLGKINWKEHTHSLEFDGTYTFDGIDANELQNNDSLFEDMMDSLKNEFSLSETSNAFSTGMNPSLYVGGRYYVSETFDVGLLSHTKFYPNHVRQDLTLSTNFRPTRAFNLSFSYSLLDATYSNFGIGVSARIFGAHMFVIVDDISLNRYNFPVADLPINPGISRDQNSFNLRFGMNLMFGCNKEKKERKDTPLLYSEDAFIY